MTAPTTHWSTTGQLHTGTVEGCGACEGVGTSAGEGATGQDTGTAWVTRSADCPEAPAQAHPLAGKGRESDSLPPRSDAGPESDPVAYRPDVIRRNLRILAHETATPPREHDTDGECCRRAEWGPDNDAQEGAQ